MSTLEGSQAEECRSREVSKRPQGGHLEEIGMDGIGDCASLVKEPKAWVQKQGLNMVW